MQLLSVKKDHFVAYFVQHPRDVGGIAGCYQLTQTQKVGLENILLYRDIVLLSLADSVQKANTRRHESRVALVFLHAIHRQHHALFNVEIKLVLHSHLIEQRKRRLRNHRVIRVSCATCQDILHQIFAIFSVGDLVVEKHPAQHKQAAHDVFDGGLAGVEVFAQFLSHAHRVLTGIQHYLVSIPVLDFGHETVYHMGIELWPHRRAEEIRQSEKNTLVNLPDHKSVVCCH